MPIRRLSKGDSDNQENDQSERRGGSHICRSFRVSDLDLVHPDQTKWGLLMNFGVTLQLEVKLYLEKLRQFKLSQSVSDIPTLKDAVAKTYLALLKYYKVEDQELIRFDFFCCY